MSAAGLSDRLFFLWVCGCWANSMIGRDYAVSRKDAVLLRLAMTVTLAADFCMLVIYDNALGLLFFTLAQYIYNLRYGGRRTLIAQVSASVSAAGSVSLLHGAAADFNDALIRSLTAAYLTAFIFSLFSAFRLTDSLARQKISKPLIRLGMSLFFLCDVNVGLYNLTAGTPGNRVFYALIWVFYLPAQAMLSSSGRKRKR